jgi:hypothetical protein
MKAALEIWVRCCSPDAREHWIQLADRCSDLSVRFLEDRSLEALTNELRQTEHYVILLVEDDVWLGDDIAERVTELVVELDRSYPNWALCGNLALCSDGHTISRFLKDATATGIERSHGPKPGLALGDSVLLLNARVLREATAELGHLDQDVSLGATLSAACLYQGLLPLADDRLFGVHPTRQVAAPAVPDPTALLPYYDRALNRARLEALPSLSIVCRTQLDRVAMLTRALRSFESAAREARGLADVSVCVVSDVSADGLDVQVRHLRERFPAVGINAWFFPVRSKQLSRIDLLLASVRKAQTDFIWFVDDDDFLLPGASLAVARALRHGKPQLIIGHSRIFHEVWRSDDEGSTLATSHAGPLYPANRVLWALGGENRIPICSAVFPVAPLRERTEGVAVLSEFMEDYFLLLQLLTKDETLLDIVDVELAGISIREGGNTVTLVDRARWHQSQAEVVGRALARPESNNPLLWRLTAELLRTRTEQEELQAILKSRSWRWTRPLRSASALLKRLRQR